MERMELMVFQVCQVMMDIQDHQELQEDEVVGVVRGKSDILEGMVLMELME